MNLKKFYSEIKKKLNYSLKKITLILIFTIQMKLSMKFLINILIFLMKLLLKIKKIMKKQMKIKKKIMKIMKKLMKIMKKLMKIKKINFLKQILIILLMKNY